MGQFDENGRRDMKDGAAADAAFLELCNVHFMELPDNSFVEWIRSEGFRALLEALSDDAEGNPDMSAGCARMASFIAGTAGMDTEALLLDLARDRTRLYRGVTPQYSPTYPAEAAWRGLEGQEAGEFIENLVALYRSYGVTPDPTLNERPDYIGVELEFLRQLDLQTISALEAGNDAKAEELVSAHDAFLQEHLSWFPAFAAKAQGFAKTDFYRGHMMMLVAYCTRPA